MPGGHSVLIVLGGLPGSGKTTIARVLARQVYAKLLRIDLIEQALRDAAGLGQDVGGVGYAVAYQLAESDLDLGQTVVADSVNPIKWTRDGWRDVAARSGARLFEVEIVCSDPAEHKRRVETRKSDIPGLKLPDWSAVLEREYESWTDADLVVDTARLTPAEASGLILSALK